MTLFLCLRRPFRVVYEISMMFLFRFSLFAFFMLQLNLSFSNLDRKSKPFVRVARIIRTPFAPLLSFFWEKSLIGRGNKFVSLDAWSCFWYLVPIGYKASLKSDGLIFALKEFNALSRLIADLRISHCNALPDFVRSLHDTTWRWNVPIVTSYEFPRNDSRRTMHAFSFQSCEFPSS